MVETTIVSVWIIFPIGNYNYKLLLKHSNWAEVNYCQCKEVTGWELIKKKLIYVHFSIRIYHNNSSSFGTNKIATRRNDTAIIFHFIVPDNPCKMSKWLTILCVRFCCDGFKGYEWKNIRRILIKYIYFVDRN